MNAIQLLKTEHETAKGMFARIEAAGASERGQLWAKLKPELKGMNRSKKSRSMAQWPKRSEPEIRR